ncbi:MAG: hypothetical protein MJ252_28105 [archaeon]|nr:hypothetical protein [archaeon]
MSDLFSLYEDSLNSVLKRIKQTLSTVKNLSKDQTENALNQMHNEIKEAERIVILK